MSDDQEEFDYVAIDRNGRRKKGSIKSSSESRAYTQLSAKGLQPIEVKLRTTNFMQKDIQIPGLEKKAKLKSLVVFTDQFAFLIKSGMPLLESIKISADQTEDTVLKAALKSVYVDVEQGLSLSDAMEKHPPAFPGLLTSVVRVGEKGGFLDKTMKSMAKTYRTELELRQMIKSAMTYPVIVVGVALAILTGMVIFVVPIFKDMFKNLDADLPIATQVLVSLSENAVIVFPLLAFLILGTVVFFKYFKNEIWLKSRVDKFKFKVPIFGPINTKTAVARFCRNLSMMLTAGVHLAPALKLVGTTSGSYHVENAVQTSIEAMENGATFSKSMEAFDMFPSLVQKMVHVGEKSGSIPPMLDSIADFYESEVTEASKRLSVSLEPILLVLLGGLVAGMLFALYLPMFTLFVKISEG